MAASDQLPLCSSVNSLQSASDNVTTSSGVRSTHDDVRLVGLQLLPVVDRSTHAFDNGGYESDVTVSCDEEIISRPSTKSKRASTTSFTQSTLPVLTSPRSLSVDHTTAALRQRRLSTDATVIPVPRHTRSPSAEIPATNSDRDNIELIQSRRQPSKGKDNSRSLGPLDVRLPPANVSSQSQRSGRDNDVITTSDDATTDRRASAEDAKTTRRTVKFRCDSDDSNDDKRRSVSVGGINTRRRRSGVFTTPDELRRIDSVTSQVELDDHYTGANGDVYSAGNSRLDLIPDVRPTSTSTLVDDYEDKSDVTLASDDVTSGIKMSADDRSSSADDSTTSADRNAQFPFDEIDIESTIWSHVDSYMPRPLDPLRRQGNWQKYRQMSTLDSLSADDLHLAAIYVTDCMHSREVHFRTSANAMRSYDLYNHSAFSIAVIFCVLILLILAFFEDSALIDPAAPFWATMIVEAVVLLMLSLRLGHKYQFSERGVFITDLKNIAIIVVMSLMVLDMIIYSIWETQTGFAVRWSRPLRPCLVILFPVQHRLRVAVVNIWKTATDIFHVLLMWLISISMFSLVGYSILRHSGLTYPNGSAYFTDYWDSFWDLYCMITTVNNPDIKIPAYNAHTLYQVFFISYQVVNFWIFMNIVLATIYNNYKQHLKDNVRTTVFMQRRLMSKAFDLLAVCTTRREWAVPSDRWQKLMKAIDPHMDDTKIDLLFYVLDDDNSDMLDKAQFLGLKELLTINLVDIDSTPQFLEKHFTRFFQSELSVRFRAMVSNRFFTYLFDVLIIANVICIALEFPRIEWAFLVAFTFEVIAYIYTRGLRKYISKTIYIFDVVLVTISWIIAIVLIANYSDAIRRKVPDFLLIIGVIRMVRVAYDIGRCRMILSTIAKTIPFMLAHCVVLMMVYYIYAIIGMELFKGVMTGDYGYTNLTDEQMYCGNPLLNGSDCWALQYCKNNFNNIVSAYIVLHDMMVVNNWNIITNGFVLAKNSKFYRIYFFSFNICCVIIMMNIFTAFIIEMYLLETSLTKDKVQSRIEQHIEELEKEAVSNTASTTERRRRKSYAEVAGLRFKLKKKSSKRAEYVLQQMFESEIDPTDSGEQHQSTDEPRRLTLSMI